MTEAPFTGAFVISFSALASPGNYQVGREKNSVIGHTNLWKKLWIISCTPPQKNQFLLLPAVVGFC
jgi:hypothetical protein